MELLWLDLRNAVRQLAARPVLTLCVLAFLALGVGANTATFSLVSGLLFRPLPYPQSESIVTVGRTSVQGFGPPILSGTQFQSLRDSAQSFEQFAAFSPAAAAWNRASTAIRIFGAAVTPSVFSLLGTTPQLGRLFVRSDVAAGGRQVILLSNNMWITRFGGDPEVVGSTLELDNEMYSVVGVMRDDFGFPHPEAEFWIPLDVAPYQVPARDGVAVEMTVVGIGRLRTGVSPEQARVEVRTLLERSGNEKRLPIGLDFETRIVPLRDELSRPLRPVLSMLAATTGLVLLMACADIAILLLAHGISRQRTLVIRRMLGATGGWVARELFIECVVLGLAGSVGAIAIAGALIRVVPLALSGSAVGLGDVGLDMSVLIFAVGLSILASLLFGTVPALFWIPVDVAATRQLCFDLDGGRFRQVWINRVQNSLVVAQVGLAVVLLAGAGLLLRSFLDLVALDRGFDPNNVVLARVETSRPGSALTGQGELDAEEVAAMSEAAQSLMDGLLVGLEDIADLAGVEAVGLSSDMPLGPGGRIQRVSIAGAPRAVDFRERLEGRIHRVSPGYADVLRLRVRSGRFFTGRDEADRPRVAVVSESFARQAFSSLWRK